MSVSTGQSAQHSIISSTVSTTSSQKQNLDLKNNDNSFHILASLLVDFFQSKVENKKVILLPVHRLEVERLIPESARIAFIEAVRYRLDRTPIPPSTPLQILTFECQHLGFHNFGKENPILVACNLVNEPVAVPVQNTIELHPFRDPNQETTKSKVSDVEAGPKRIGIEEDVDDDDNDSDHAAHGNDQSYDDDNDDDIDSNHAQMTTNKSDCSGSSIIKVSKGSSESTANESESTRSYNIHVIQQPDEDANRINTSPQPTTVEASDSDALFNVDLKASLSKNTTKTTLHEDLMDRQEYSVAVQKTISTDDLKTSLSKNLTNTSLHEDLMDRQEYSGAAQKTIPTDRQLERSVKDVTAPTNHQSNPNPSHETSISTKEVNSDGSTSVHISIFINSKANDITNTATADSDRKKTVQPKLSPTTIGSESFKSADQETSMNQTILKDVNDASNTTLTPEKTSLELGRIGNEVPTTKEEALSEATLLLGKDNIEVVDLTQNKLRNSLSIHSEPCPRMKSENINLINSISPHSDSGIAFLQQRTLSWSPMKMPVNRFENSIESIYIVDLPVEEQEPIQAVTCENAPTSNTVEENVSQATKSRSCDPVSPTMTTPFELEKGSNEDCESSVKSKRTKSTMDWVSSLFSSSVVTTTEQPVLGSDTNQRRYIAVDEQSTFLPPSPRRQRVRSSINNSLIDNVSLGSHTTSNQIFLSSNNMKVTDASVVRAPSDISTAEYSFSTQNQSCRQQLLMELKEAETLKENSENPEIQKIWSDHCSELQNRLTALDDAVSRNSMSSSPRRRKSRPLTSGSSHGSSAKRYVPPILAGATSTDVAFTALAAPVTASVPPEYELPMVDVIAPADLPGGYYMEAEVDGQRFLATVPSGGVKQGETFTCYMRELDSVGMDIPVGYWKDDFSSTCKHGCCHLMLLNTIFCPLLALGQIQYRVNLDFLGRLSIGTDRTSNRYMMITTIAFWSGTNLALFGACNLKWSRGLELTFADVAAIALINLAMLGFVIFVTQSTRSSVREKYLIREERCFDLEDLCCSIWCLPCTISQMSRHTANYDKYNAVCCSHSGLPDGVTINDINCKVFNECNYIV